MTMITLTQAIQWAEILANISVVGGVIFGAYKWYGNLQLQHYNIKFNKYNDLLSALFDTFLVIPANPTTGEELALEELKNYECVEAKPTKEGSSANPYRERRFIKKQEFEKFQADAENRIARAIFEINFLANEEILKLAKELTSETEKDKLQLLKEFVVALQRDLRSLNKNQIVQIPDQVVIYNGKIYINDERS